MNSIARKRKAASFLAILVSLAALGMAGCRSRLPWSEEKQKSYIAQLKENGLPEAAAREYELLAYDGSLSAEQRANALYLAGVTCADDLKDYEKALQLFLKATVMGPKRSLASEIRRRTIECLERLGRSYDAQRALSAATDLQEAKPVPGQTVVARYGNRSITMENLEKEIRALPAYLQKTLASPDKKLEFLKQYIATELMYDSAVRRGYDRDPGLATQMEQFRKNMMVQKLIDEDIASKITVSDQEIAYYYEANKQRFMNEKKQQIPLAQARESAAALVRMQKEQTQASQLIEQLLKTKKVDIYDDVFKERK